MVIRGMIMQQNVDVMNGMLLAVLPHSLPHTLLDVQLLRIALRNFEVLRPTSLEKSSSKQLFQNLSASYSCNTRAKTAELFDRTKF